jgi:hypothetical protein
MSNKSLTWKIGTLWELISDEIPPDIKEEVARILLELASDEDCDDHLLPKSLLECRK